MIAYVPTRGARTIYAMVGDVFAWLCIAALALLTGAAAYRGRRPRTAPRFAKRPAGLGVPDTVS